MAGKLPGSAIQSNTITITQIQTTAVTTIVEQAGPRVSSLIYPGNDTAGNTVGGQTVYINGAGFETNNAIYINGNAVPSKSFISASNISFTTPALSAGIYPVYVINTDSGATAIFVPGYISSAEPSWVTSAGSLSESQDELTAWSYSLSATGDAPITYALAVGSSLPTGVSLAANGLISGTITSPSGNTTTYTFSVVATDAQNQDSTRQFTVTTATGEGVLFANNVLLIHADGTNNQNNHAFLDSSNNNFTITRNGNATQGSFSPFSQTGWSGYFDGSGDSLLVPLSTNLAFGTGDFTIECWIYFNSVSIANQGFYSMIDDSNDAWAGVRFNANSSTFQAVSYNSGALEHTISHQTALQANKWHHCAVTRSGTTMRIFLDGVVGSTTATTSTNYGQSGSTIGSAYPGAAPFAGYISNLRVIKGTAQYTATFTPPTAPLTNIANTSLLTLQSNRFIDNSNNNFTITRNGDTSIQAFSPFAPTAAYSTANVGGSAYFDGTGDWLLTASSPATLSGDFTVEGWVYIPSLAGARSLVCIGDDRAATGVIFAITADGRLRLYGNDAVIVTGTSQTVTVNSWHHVAFVRSSGTVRLYLNGVVDATTASNSTAFTGINRIGGELYNGTNGGTVMLGYISNYRLINGTAVYTSNFVPPSAPLTNIANTSLLCNFTNAGIFDQTAKNILETVGDAKVSTAQYKYGTGSVVFDGTGDYLVTQSSVLNALGSGDFTIEMWLYPSNTSSAYRAIIASDAYTATTNGWTVYQNGTSIEMYYSSGGSTPNIFTATSALTSSVWQHFALVRSSGTLKAYVNGTQVASVSNSINFVGDKIFIGDNNAGDYFFNGYIDDLRITKGYARYTSNFTPPTSALKDK